MEDDESTGPRRKETGTATASELLTEVYDELRGIARHRISQERPDHSLTATALVHEAYLRVLGPRQQGVKGWDSQRHFFAAAAEAMRRILVDHARARGTAKRGDGRRGLNLSLSKLSIGEIPVELLDLDDALRRFEAHDPSKAELVKLRYFVGMTLPQAATTLGISTTTADRHWAYARAWLRAAMSSEI
ncbi:MAG: RNA polymerase sigma factor (TIGR02999 family) [Planctomycetota bacterium]